MASSTSHLLQLLQIITDSVHAIEAAGKDAQQQYPSLDVPFNPTSGSEQLAMNPAVIQASMLGASAASQLAATLKLPGLTIIDKLTSFHVASALRVATETNVVEVLREAGPSGLHANDIGKKTNTDPSIIGRVLRLLATHYVFREVEPNVFTNNRLSSMIDTGKPSKLLIELAKKKAVGTNEQGVNLVQPEKYAGTTGIAALIEHSTDEVFKASAYFPESVLDPSKTAFTRAFGIDLPAFEWIEMPTHQGYLARLHAAMEGTTKVEPYDAILQGFKWQSLPDNALVVDVGGGNGSSAVLIANAVPHLRIILQDRPPVIEHAAKPFWASDKGRQSLIASKRVSLEVHDFFKPQPDHVKGKADVFLLRIILHDWPQSKAQAILENMHNAAGPHTRLLIIDQIAPYACLSPKVGKDIEGASTPAPPPPLLPNLGEAASAVYSVDMQMHALTGGQERTLGEFIDVTKAASWKIVKIHSVPGSIVRQIECVKAA